MNEQRVKKMLESVPVGSCTDSIHMWQRLKPMKLKMLQHYWEKVELDQPFWDFENATYTSWTDRKGKHFGMRDRVTNERQGVIRTFDNQGKLTEGTFKNGKPHGLERQLLYDEARITLYRNGNKYAELEIGPDGVEVFRYDPDKLLKDFNELN